jgi:hypothetical protein
VKFLYAFLCDGAEARPDGRLDAHGVFHQLFAPGFPARQDALTLVLAVEWEEGEEGDQEFRIDLLDPSRSPVLTVQGSTEVRERRRGEAPPLTRLVLPTQNVIFPVEGTYEFVLHVADRKIPCAPLHLIEHPDEPGGQERVPVS